MVHKSIKVKKGQRIIAGQVVGKMGDTGFATGKQLHWEIWAGHRTAQPNINSGGKGFYDPMAFTKAAIDWDKVHVDAPLETPADAPVAVMPAHSLEPAVAPVKAVLKPVLKVGSKGAAVKSLQSKLKIVADGDFGAKTKAAVIAFQKKHDLTADGVVGSATWAKLG
jgi:hypothetical protein